MDLTSVPPASPGIAPTPPSATPIIVAISKSMTSTLRAASQQGHDSIPEFIHAAPL